MAKAMHSFKAYPSDKEVAKAAEALVSQHPCLREPGSQCGWYGWKTSLKFKMGNYRTKLSRSGCDEVAVNSGKRSQSNQESECPHSNIKKARRAEIAAEFHRITNISLKNKFYAELDKHPPPLLAVYRQKAARTGKAAEALRSIFSAYDLLTEEVDEPDIADSAVALVSMVNGDSSSTVQFDPAGIAVVLEVYNNWPKFKKDY
ncbi:uncharacterized protein LOC107669590 [Sinocyclocheilus anshuiensis]|uniref:uncharacterized protein LOC107669590 n=1 Tax=Sinocyclocheilus anshuiensis TaxID=1608454 RepID=UPI0007B8B6E7|nr:PREDICTED: uncharacterized protein LOC107669590 [Sinocyclocheilus anshuiensis]